MSIHKHTEIVCGSILLNSGIEKLSCDMRKAILMLVLKHKEKLVEMFCLHMHSSKLAKCVTGHLGMLLPVNYGSFLAWLGRVNKKWNIKEIEGDNINKCKVQMFDLKQVLRSSFVSTTPIITPDINILSKSINNLSSQRQSWSVREVLEGLSESLYIIA